MSTLSSTTLSHVFRGVARISSEVCTILQKPLTPSATSPSPTSNVPKGGGYYKPKRFTISKITSCVYFHVLRTTSHIKKISRCGRAGTAKKCTKKRAKHTRNVQLSSPSSFLIKPRPSFTDVCKSLGIRMCF